MNREIGGYFELEANSRNNYLYNNLFHLNSGRNCLEYILIKKNYSKVYLPYFTCDAVLEPILKNKIVYEFFDVNSDLEAIFDFSKVKSDEAVILTNYFGLKTEYIKLLCRNFKNVIVDNAQAFFAEPINEIDTFYSPRKFVGLADGGLLSTSLELDEDLEQSTSYHKVNHLFKRIDLGAQVAYQDFQETEELISSEKIMKMSNLTKRMLMNVDLDLVKKERIKNYTFLNNNLKEINELNFELSNECVPLVYPFKTKNAKVIRDVLLKEKIFCAKYWPNVEEWCNVSHNSYCLAEGIIALPIDQRYNENDMSKILKIILNE